MTVFNPVNLELGIIPSRINKILDFSNPGQELKIHRANNFLFKKIPQSH